MLSPRFDALLSTRGGPFRLLLPLTCRPVSSSPGESLPGGLLEGSCGRRKRRNMRNRPKVGTSCPLQNIKRSSSEGGVEKNFDCTYISTDTRYGMFCIYSFIYLFVYLLSIDYLQNVHIERYRFTAYPL